MTKSQVGMGDTRGPKWAFLHPFQLRLSRGIESYLWELTTALSRTGVTPHIITWDGRETPPEFASGIRLFRAPAVRYYQPWAAVPFSLWRLLRGRYDHVFVNFAGYGEGPLLSVLSKLGPAPFSIVLHFPRTLVPHRYQEFEQWSMQSKAAHIIGVSAYVASQAIEWSHRECAVIGHGVDTFRYRPDPALRLEVRSSLGISSNAPVLITAAAMEERKGMQWVIRALPSLLPKYPDIIYLILGDGAYRVSLEQMSRDLGVAECVRFLGSVDTVPAYLAAADLGLIVSREEASSLSLLEYASAGLPGITSRRPPFNELVHPEWARMVDEEDTAMLASTIDCFLADANLRSTMGRAGRAWVEQHYSWDAVAHSYRILIG